MRRKLRAAPAVRAKQKERALNSSPTRANSAASATSATSAYPRERSLKLQLAAEVNRMLQQHGLTQTEAAEKLGIVQPHISELAHYRLERFSAERLMQFLAQLGQEVEIRIHGGASQTRGTAVRRIFVR